MDHVARHNKEVWEKQANESHCPFSRPFLDLTEDSAWKMINREGISLEMRGKDVLCLASGGGQQSAAFGVLGANVTVLDLSDNMLKKDVETAKHYGFPIRVEQGDMRDISIFEDECFDIVFLGGAAIDYVPEVDPVINEVRRVLRSKGFFKMCWSNPYFIGLFDKYVKEYKEGKRGWDGYAITEPYIEGVEIESPYGTESDTPACYSFRHTLSKVINLLLSERLRLLGLWEHRTDYYFEELGQNPEPGSPRHLRNLIPIMVTIWAQKA